MVYDAVPQTREGSREWGAAGEGMREDGDIGEDVGELEVWRCQVGPRLSILYVHGWSTNQVWVKKWRLDAVGLRIMKVERGRATTYSMN